MNAAKIIESVSYIKNKINIKPEIGVILGSGLGDMAESLSEKVVIEYSEVPNLPRSTVKGHKGQFVFGRLNDKYVVMMQGRFHYYEGHTMQETVLPVYIMKNLGVEKLIVTNAAGGVNLGFKPGDLMIIKDHINYSFSNPLIGGNDEKVGPRFTDMTEAYNRDFISVARTAGEKLGITLQEGTYFMFSGPTYETPSEIKMVRILGGDAVGMSTVPEVIAARHSGLKVLGISCITNMAAGILNQPLNHEEVIETSTKVKDKFISLINEIIRTI
jgi:purine-nucleoside phosphorylase